MQHRIPWEMPGERWKPVIKTKQLKLEGVGLDRRVERRKARAVVKGWVKCDKTADSWEQLPKASALAYDQHAATHEKGKR
jgi:hypothetical protein